MTLVNDKILAPDTSPQGDGYAVFTVVAAVGSDGVGFVATYSGTIVGPTRVKGDSKGPTGSGAFSVDLIPNSLIAPANTVYRVQLYGGGVAAAPFYISVPGAGGPYRLQDILTSAPTDLPGGTPHGAASHVGDVIPDASDQTLGAGSLNLAQRTAPAAPAAGSRTLFVDSADGHAKVEKSDGSLVDLETGGGGGGLTGGTPALSFGTTNAAGAAATGIRTDAQLALFDATAPSTQGFGDAAAVGAAGVAARRDHKHAMPTSTAGPDADATVDAAGAAGTADTAARSQHGHKVATTAGPGADAVVDGAGAAGATGAIARATHGHKVATTAGPGADVTPDAAGAAGATGAIARATHGHQIVTASAAPPDADATAASAGTSGTAPARGDHRHHGHAQSHDHSAAGDGQALAPATTFALTGDISPAQITADQNDYNPAGLSTASILRINSDAARNITGLQGGTDGRIVLVHNIGSFAITLKDENASSSAANRFALIEDVILQVDELVMLQYDSTSSRWRAQVGASTVAGPDADITVDAAGGAGTMGLFARSQHGHKLSTSATAALATTTGAGTAGTSGHAPSRDDHTHQTGAHGATEHTDITRTIFLPRIEMTLDSGTSVALGTVPDAIGAVGMADAATQGAYGVVYMPKDAKAATGITIRPVWSPGSTDAVAHTVRWSVDAFVENAGVTVDTAGTTTAFTGVSAARTAKVLVVETGTQILASVSADDLIRINIRRLGADAADTYVGVVNLVGFYIDYTAVQ